METEISIGIDNGLLQRYKNTSKKTGIALGKLISVAMRRSIVFLEDELV
jgi:hypothetical protein